MVLGVSFGLYADNAFFTLLPMYLYELGFAKVNGFHNTSNLLSVFSYNFSNQSHTALVVTTGAAADMFSRIFLAIMSLFVEIKARNIFLAGAIMIIIVRFSK